jgi:predicted transcriptional regulator
MSRKGTWTFITNHGAVLSYIGQHSCITVREIAVSLGITERSVHRILKDLLDDGYIVKTKEGRLNHYEVNEHLSLRHTSHHDTLVGDLLAALVQKS